MKKIYYLVHEEYPVYILLSDNWSQFDSLRKGISLHWNTAHKLNFLSNYGSPIMVWFGNKVTKLDCFQDKICFPVCLFAQGKKARARDP